MSIEGFNGEENYYSSETSTNMTTFHNVVALLDRVSYSEDVNDRVAARLELMKQHTTLVEQRDLLAAALRKIAAFDDESANRRLRETGSYSSFDEPGAVRAARQALATVQQDHEEQAGGGRDD